MYKFEDEIYGNYENAVKSIGMTDYVKDLEKKKIHYLGLTTYQDILQENENYKNNISDKVKEFYKL